MENRRDFIKKISAMGGLSALSILPAGAVFKPGFEAGENIRQGELIKLKIKALTDHLKPLSNLNVSSDKSGILWVFDGNGVQYYNSEIDKELKFKIGGGIGTHLVILTDKKERILDVAAFKVDCKTEILDKGKEFEKMLEMLLFSCRVYRPAYYRMLGKTMKTFAGWFQDHVHVFKAMKYFDDDVKSGIDLWAMGQREDGMLADNCYQKHDSYKSWLNRFGERFVWGMGSKEESSTFYIRIPVENMSEFTFLEGVYYVWKATGDDAWMEAKLENCKKAIQYATSDDYRWSEKFKLLKRGYTIDIWDFQPEMDIEVWDGDIMMAKPGVTEYSVMYGDNVGMSVGCKYLAEMLEYAGRNKEAEKYKELGEVLLDRLNKLSWTGEHYLHHVQENPDIKRDFGDVDVDKQVTISSAYAINRRIGHDKSVALIKTYQKIRREMPESSPGEWYMCFPPYEKGWHNEKWEYMNGGVSSIVGGEVAHGAFWHGFEDYGVDCLRRLNEMAQISDNFMKCIYRGAITEDPVRKFRSLSIAKIANADTHGTGAPGVPGFTGEGVNDFSRFPTGKQVFHDVPFDLVKPEENGRKACLIISRDEGYTKSAKLDFEDKAKSFYIVHTQAGGNHLGQIVLNYTDGSRHVEYITNGQNISGWWYPQENNKNLKVAASVTNEKSLSVGAFLWAFNNPHPEKEINNIGFEGAEAPGKWIIMGITSSDYPVYFKPSRASYGAPDNWGAAAVIYALVEGLAGLKDNGIAFRKAILAPRWEAAGIDEVSATAKYESSGGYLSYIYKKTDDGKYLITFTGSGEEIEFRLLLPDGKKPVKVKVNGEEQPVANTENVEDSTYLVLRTAAVGVYEVEVSLI